MAFIDGNLILQDMTEASPSLQEYDASNGIAIQDTGVSSSHYALALLSDGRIVYCSTRESDSNIGIRILNADGSDGGTLTDPLETADIAFFVRNISVDLQDNIYIIGAVSAFGQADFDPTAVEGDKIFVRKFDSLGQYITHMDFACTKGRGHMIRQGRPMPCTLISPCDSTETIVTSECTASTVGFLDVAAPLPEGAAITRDGTIAYFLMNRFLYKCVLNGEAVVAEVFKDFADSIFIVLGDEVVDTSHCPSGGLIVDSSGNIIINMYEVSTRDWEHRRFIALELDAAQVSILSGNSYVVDFNAVESYMNMPVPVLGTQVSGVDDPSIPDPSWGISGSVRVAGSTEVSVLITGAPLGPNNPKVVTLTGAAQTVTALAIVPIATATGITVTNNGPGTLTLGTTSSGSACASVGNDKELGTIVALNFGTETLSYWSLDQQTYDPNGNLVNTHNIMTWPQERLDAFGQPWVTTARWMAINSSNEVFYFFTNGVPYQNGLALDYHVELWKDNMQIKEKFIDFFESNMPPLLVVGGGVVPPTAGVIAEAMMTG